jgi:hypothetical protein
MVVGRVGGCLAFASVGRFSVLIAIVIVIVVGFWLDLAVMFWREKIHQDLLVDFVRTEEKFGKQTKWETNGKLNG